MIEFLYYIFYSDTGSDFNNFALLVFRVLMSLEMVRVHGLKKLNSGGGEAETLPNPLRLPAKLNQFIAGLSDLVAPLFVALGLATRVATLPILAVTLTGYLVVHRRDPLSVRDVSYIYSLGYLYVFLVGAGTFSADYYVSRYFQ
jgi:putative oxidoreductase